MYMQMLLMGSRVCSQAVGICKDVQSVEREESVERALMDRYKFY